MRADDVRQVHEAPLDAGAVQRELARVADGLARLGKEAEHDLARGEALRDTDAHVAVVGKGEEGVGVAAKRPDAAELRGLVSLARRNDGRLALAVEHPHPLVERANERHRRVDVEQVVTAEGLDALWRRTRLNHRSKIVAA